MSSIEESGHLLVISVVCSEKVSERPKVAVQQIHLYGNNVLQMDLFIPKAERQLSFQSYQLAETDIDSRTTVTSRCLELKISWVAVSYTNIAAFFLSS
jgi:hypothetical protein